MEVQAVLEKQLKNLEAELNKFLDKEGLRATLQSFKTRADELGYSSDKILRFVVVSETVNQAEKWLPFAKERAKARFYKSAYDHYILHI